MSAPETTKKSFFSGLHLVITGLAALVTASVAVLGLALNQGWIGGGSRSSHGDTAPVPQYLVAPSSIVVQLLQPSATIEVSNTGVVPMTVETPTVTGPNAARFAATIGTCSGSIDPGRSCQLQVTFRPMVGTFNATVVIKVNGAVQATEIPVKAGI